MNRFYNVGGYLQKIWPNGGISCTCIHGSIKFENWEKGDTICWHIKELMPLSKQRVELLRKFVRYICEDCHKHERKVGILEPHRINQDLGYNIRNIKMCCSKCHKIFNSAQRIAAGTQS
ncbi:MAG TPA: hypothetical protein ENH85_01690 [Candidatus Scalindua sp.]|nr:hypothetical protein [Candidatus Scalindua sp.]